MTPMLTSSVCQKPSTRATAARVISTAAAASATTRTNAATERYAALSPAMRSRAVAPRPPSSTSSAARWRDMRLREDSAAASRNATSRLTRAARSSWVVISAARRQRAGRLRPARKVSSRVRCSSNISRSSSGSAWS